MSLGLGVNNLLDGEVQKCQFITPVRAKDGVGGWITQYVDGETFDAAFDFDGSPEAKIAAAMGVTSQYTVTSGRELTLEYHEIFRRLSDGMVFRVTSNGNDRKTPPSAGLNMRQVSAEEYKLPTNTN